MNCLRILYLLDAGPLLRFIVALYFRAVLGEKSGQFVAADPYLVIPFPLGFVKNQLQAEVQMILINVIRILFRAVAGSAYISDDIPCLHHRSFL